MRAGVELGSLALVFGLFATAGAVEVAIAPDRMLVVDGERTFILGIYENPDNDALLDEVAGAGYNLVRCSANAEALDRLEARGLYAWVNAGGRIDLGADGADDPTGLEELVQDVGGHPALLVWEVPDEALWYCWVPAYDVAKPIPECVRDFRKRAADKCAGLVAGYQKMKQLDPGRPVWMNHAPCNSLKDLADFNRAADIVGCDIYPLFPYPTRLFDVSRRILGFVGIQTDRMQRAAPEKPVWMVLQGFSWADVDVLFRHRDAPGQRPTFAESRFMAYDAIVRGARGILYWGTHHADKEGAQWRSLMRLGRELADLQSVLSAPDAAVVPGVEARSALLPLHEWVRALGKDVDGQVWWLVVNELPVAMRYTLRGLDPLEGTTYTDAFADRQATVTDGVLSFPIDGYGVHVLRPGADRE